MTSQNYLYPDALIIIFAREPIPGQVKTRLIPALGKEGAANLYKRLLDYAVQNVSSANLAPANLCITPESCKQYFTQINSSSSFEFSEQVGEDLGSRMHNALASGLKKYSKIILIGTDCPFLSKDDLQQAIEALDSNDMVFSPARDGGYVLVGASKLTPDLFENIDWGTERVMEQSRKNLHRYGFSWHELSIQFDIDDENDFKYLLEHNEFKEIYSEFKLK